MFSKAESGRNSELKHYKHENSFAKLPSINPEVYPDFI